MCMHDNISSNYTVNHTILIVLLSVYERSDYKSRYTALLKSFVIKAGGALVVLE